MSQMFSQSIFGRNLWKKKALNGFIETVNESNRKPNKLWVDRGKEFYNSPMQKLLDYNDI